MLRSVRDRHEDAEIDHRELYSAEVIAALGERSIDVGFAILPIDHPDLVARPLLAGHWIIVIPESHPLAALEEVPVDKLAGEPLVLFARQLNPPLYDLFVARLREGMGAEPRVVYRTAQAQTGPNLVAEGVGLFVVASYIPRTLPRGVTMRRLAGFAPLRVAAVWRADDTSEVLRAFREALPKKVTSPVPVTE